MDVWGEEGGRREEGGKRREGSFLRGRFGCF